MEDYPQAAQNFQVYIRVKPLNKSKFDSNHKDTILSKIDGNMIAIKDPDYKVIERYSRPK